MLADHCGITGRNHFRMCSYRQSINSEKDEYYMILSFIFYTFFFLLHNVKFLTSNLMKGVCSLLVRTLLRPAWSCGGRDRDAAVTRALEVARLPEKQLPRYRLDYQLAAVIKWIFIKAYSIQHDEGKSYSQLKL